MATPVSEFDSSRIESYIRLYWADGGAPSLSAQNLNKSDVALFNLLDANNGYIQNIVKILNDEIAARTEDIKSANTAIREESETRLTSDNTLKNSIDEHITSTDNPHNVTKAQLELDKVENKDVSDIKSDLKGSIEESSLGFVTGSDVWNNLEQVKKLPPVEHKHKLSDISDYVAPVIPNLSNYYTKTETQQAITDYDSKTVQPYFNNYYTKTEIEQKTILANDTEEIRLYCGNSVDNI